MLLPVRIERPVGAPAPRIARARVEGNAVEQTIVRAYGLAR